MPALVLSIKHTKVIIFSARIPPRTPPLLTPFLPRQTIATGTQSKSSIRKFVRRQRSFTSHPVTSPKGEHQRHHSLPPRVGSPTRLSLDDPEEAVSVTVDGRYRAHTMQVRNVPAMCCRAWHRSIVAAQNSGGHRVSGWREAADARGVST
jgi:hypothetical protein